MQSNKEVNSVQLWQGGDFVRRDGSHSRYYVPDGPKLVEAYIVLVEKVERLLYIAEHLFQMVPQSVWRDSGSDDMQGHYEGDYHAEKLQEELAEHRAALGNNASS